MRNKKHSFLKVFALALMGTLFMAGPSQAADDPSIKGELRKNIQKSMKKFIKTNTVDGSFYIYDAVKGNLLDLTLVKLHDGIVKKGEFYISCADFKDSRGKKVDLDFLVVPDGRKLKTLQAVVHKTDGKKRPYHLETN